MASRLRPRFYRGNYRQDAREAEHLGVRKFWIVGHFMPEEPRKTSAAEIKYWEVEPGPTARPTKVSTVFECTLILEGCVHGQIDGQPVDLAAGEYVVIPPGVVSNIPGIVHEKTAGLTIKAPSIPGSKITFRTAEAPEGPVPAGAPCLSEGTEIAAYPPRDKVQRMRSRS